MKQRESFKNVIGYCDKTAEIGVYGNCFIRESHYYNIIVENLNVNIKNVFHHDSIKLSRNILAKDKVIKDAYEKSLSV